MAPRIDPHEARLDERARRWAARLEAEQQTRPPRAAWTRPLRAGLQTVARVARQLREAVASHWDVGAFDLAFGSVKAFGVYPALFAMGLGWTIPLAEYAPLNTQLWTAGYLVVRRRIASALGRRRFGYSLARLEARRDALLGGAEPRGVVHHTLGLQGAAWGVRLQRRSWARLWNRWRGVAPLADAISVRALRRAIADPELCLQAARLRHNPFLYERVLLHWIGAHPETRRALEGRLQPAPPRPEGCLVGELSPVSEAVQSALVDQADALRTALGTRSLERMALRWLHGAYRRKIRRQMVDGEEAGYRILAALLDQERGGERGRLAALRRERLAARARLELWAARCEAFATRVEGLRGDAQVRRALAREVALAGALGLRCRRASAVLGLGEWIRAAEAVVDGALFGAGR